MDSKRCFKVLVFIVSSIFILFKSHLAVADWYIETVKSAHYAGGYTSIAIDSNGNPHISYYGASAQLEYAYYDGSWHRVWVDLNRPSGLYSSIALDSNDKPRISYYWEWSFFPSGNLKYAWCNGNCGDRNNWIWRTVDTNVTNVGLLYTSLALDSNDDPHISYYDKNAGNLKYAWCEEDCALSDWDILTLDFEGDVGLYTSIALDSNDDPHISYYDATNQGLKYLFYSHSPPSGARWTLDRNAPSDIGRYTSIALGSNDDAHISYHATEAWGDLKYAYFQNRLLLDIETIDINGYVGEHTSIALDSNDNPHISYYDRGGDLKYAYHDGNTWHREIVDDTDDVGKWTSIALDSNDHPHISYYDATHETVKYATIDTDGDGVPDNWDDCPNTSDTDQINSDNDSHGDVCDNCPWVENENQNNQDSDSYGDACDNCWYEDNQNQTDSNTNCPNMPYLSDPECGDICESTPTTSSTTTTPTTTTSILCESAANCDDDGQFCNGAEVCIEGRCQSEGNPCPPILFCNEDTNACEQITVTTTTTPQPIPTTTTTGLQTTTASTAARCPCLIEKIYSENAEEVAFLRSFRDEVLSKTPSGRELIRLYYRVSPMVIELLEENDLVRDNLIMLYYEWGSTIIKAMEEDEEFRNEIMEMIDELLPMIEAVEK